MQEEVIKSGYNFIVSSWENDADHRNKVIYNVVNFEFAKLVAKILKIVKESKQVNIYEGDLEPIFEDTDILEHIINIEEIVETNEDAMNFLADLLWDLGLTNSSYNCRVVDNYKCVYFPSTVYAENVTKQLLHK